MDSRNLMNEHQQLGLMRCQCLHHGREGGGFPAVPAAVAVPAAPSAPGVPDWPPFELSSRQMLEIGAELKVVTDVRGTRVNALTRATGGSLTAASP